MPHAPTAPPTAPPRPTQPHVLRTQRTDTGCLFYLHIPEDLSYFEGHFPQQPILAGVCQLKWVIDFIQADTGKTVQLTEMHDVKFLRPLFPGQSCILALKSDPATASWQYEIYTHNQRFASGRLLVQLT